MKYKAFVVTNPISHAVKEVVLVPAFVADKLQESFADVVESIDQEMYVADTVVCKSAKQMEQTSTFKELKDSLKEEDL